MPTCGYLFLRWFYLVCILQSWRNTLKLGWYACRWIKYRELRFTVVCLICHQIWEFQAVVLQRTARNCSKVRATRARLFVLTQPIKFLLSGVVIAVLLLMRKLNFNISATSAHVLWVIDFMQSALRLHGVITRAIHLMRNTKGSFTCDWDFSAFQPTTWLHNFGKPLD